MQVMLNLNHSPLKPLEWAMLLVGLSCARSGGDVLILPQLTMTEHLFNLKWDCRLQEWWKAMKQDTCPSNRRGYKRKHETMDEEELRGK